MIPPLTNKVPGDIRRVAAKLSVDALGLFVVAGGLYLLAEFILPGIFSSRVNFFLFFLVLATLMLLGTLTFRALDGETSDPAAHTILSKPTRIGLAVLATIFLFWAEKKIPLAILIPLAVVTLLILLSFFSDFFGKSDVNKKTDGSC